MLSELESYRKQNKVIPFLKRRSKEAKENNNEISGLFGIPLEEFTKEELIQMIHILNDAHIKGEMPVRSPHDYRLK